MNLPAGLFRNIPTRYAGIQFRSRLEARWGALFDLLGWHYEYEPFDLDGWIPDFLLTDGRVLVEVKPVTDRPQEIAAEIDRALPVTKRPDGRWPDDGYEPLIVGCVLPVDRRGIDLCDGVPIGWMRGTPGPRRPDLEPRWERGLVQVFEHMRWGSRDGRWQDVPVRGNGLFHSLDYLMQAEFGASPHPDRLVAYARNRLGPPAGKPVFNGVAEPLLKDDFTSAGIQGLLVDAWHQAGNLVQWHGRRLVDLR
jgi:hypothetical protein